MENAPLPNYVFPPGPPCDMFHQSLQNRLPEGEGEDMGSPLPVDRVEPLLAARGRPLFPAIAGISSAVLKERKNCWG